MTLHTFLSALPFFAAAIVWIIVSIIIKKHGEIIAAYHLPPLPPPRMSAAQTQAMQHQAQMQMNAGIPPWMMAGAANAPNAAGLQGLLNHLSAAAGAYGQQQQQAASVAPPIHPFSTTTVNAQMKVCVKLLEHALKSNNRMYGSSRMWQDPSTGNVHLTWTSSAIQRCDPNGKTLGLGVAITNAAMADPRAMPAIVRLFSKEILDGYLFEVDQNGEVIYTTYTAQEINGVYP